MLVTFVQNPMTTYATSKGILKQNMFQKLLPSLTFPNKVDVAVTAAMAAVATTPENKHHDAKKKKKIGSFKLNIKQWKTIGA